VVLLTGFAIYFLSDDCPFGNYTELKKRKAEQSADEDDGGTTLHTLAHTLSLSLCHTLTLPPSQVATLLPSPPRSRDARSRSLPPTGACGSSSWYTPHSLALSHTLTHNISHTHTLTHTLSLSRTHTLLPPLSLALSHTHSHTHTLSLSRSLSVSHTHSIRCTCSASG